MSTITIRRAAPEDYAAVHQIHAAPSVIADTLQLPYASPEVWRQRLADDTPGAWSLVAEAGGAVIGIVRLEMYAHPRCAHAGTFGISVMESWQGKGVASKLMQAMLDLADNWLNLKRLELEVFVDNAPAIALYQRFGFEREGLKRMHAYRNGAFVDALVMARLRP